jgi:peptidoglycan hydrolase-like protein with peptidoglycan-binding domain
MGKFSECGAADQAASDASSLQSLGTGIGITASVGRGGVNRRPDVSLIQQTLNLIPVLLGGPTIKLAVDGLSGPKTEGGIYGFQVHHFGASKADARIDPGFATISTLESTFASSGEAKKAKDKIDASIPQALQWIFLAQKSLVHTLAFLNGDMGGNNEKHFDLVDRCFKLRTVNNIKAKRSVQHIGEVFGRMPFAVVQLVAFNQIKPVAKCKPGTIATAIPGGFLSANLAHKGISYCPKMIAAKNLFDVTDVIVHELAHYTGPFGNKAVGHGGVTPPAYGLKAFTLNHERSLISASNYSWLAWLVRLPQSQWMTNKG